MNGLGDSEGDATEEGAGGESGQDLEDVDVPAGGGVPFATARLLENGQIGTEQAASGGKPEAERRAREQVKRDGYCDAKRGDHCGG